ncbi:thymidylate synthase [Aureitalea marina]|uniref:STAS/SEC14 domain-containing protein n=1 Tax=Aureitalea marina TaxID=930804 RepID=A0A2S7KR12_9FLAO|nr:thymidylate synthase [Aureitalea marina]PQB05064.1 hypothetical protein BST85_09270 [Aureitalea marina]
MSKQIAIPFGILDFYDTYVTFLVSCERITKEIAKEILNHTDEYFEGNPYVFISNRVFSSRVDPAAYSVVDSSKLIGIAIVSESEQTVLEARREEPLYDGQFQVFRNLEKAKVWAEEIMTSSDDHPHDSSGQ